MVGGLQWHRMGPERINYTLHRASTWSIHWSTVSGRLDSASWASFFRVCIWVSTSVKFANAECDTWVPHFRRPRSAESTRLNPYPCSPIQLTRTPERTDLIQDAFDAFYPFGWARLHSSKLSDARTCLGSQAYPGAQYHMAVSVL